MMQELNYIRCGDYYIPDIRLPEENKPIGRWGRVHRDYIKEHKPIRFNDLCLSGELWTYLANLNEQAQSRLELIIEQMKAAEGVTERMKQHDQTAWVGAMNSIRNRAAEIIPEDMEEASIRELIGEAVPPLLTKKSQNKSSPKEVWSWNISVIQQKTRGPADPPQALLLHYYILIEIFDGVVLAVADILHDRVALLAGRCEGGIHALPGFAVEHDGTVHPAGFFGPDADPCVVRRAGIANHQLAGNALAAEHGGHQSGVIEADALLFRQNRVHHGQVAALDGGSLLGVVHQIAHHEVIDRANLLQQLHLWFHQLPGHLYSVRYSRHKAWQLRYL